jgi:hypothetical protein
MSGYVRPKDHLTPHNEDLDSHGVLSGQHVGPWATDNDLKIIMARAVLHERIFNGFRDYQNTKIRSGSELEHIRKTKFKVWFTQQNPYAESAWQLFVAISPDSHPKSKDIIEALPDLFDGFELYCAPWPEQLVQTNLTET